MSDDFSIYLRDLQSGIGLYSIDLCRVAHDAAVIALSETDHSPPVDCVFKDQGTELCSMSIDWSEAL